jgi:preprotein translocase subunit SecG
MQSVLIVIHLIIIVMLVVTVLLQRSEGGALGIGGGGGFLTGRGQANALTRATAILAALFFATSLGLSILARLNQGPEVTFQSVTPIEPGGAGKEGQANENLLDQLKQMEGEPAHPPALPPGASLPGETSVPAGTDEAAPEETHSLMEVSPQAQGVKLPAPKHPATPVSELPTSTGPATSREVAPAPKPLPYKTQPLASEPWAK